ncbi:MAG: hypothetical protein K0U84_04395 [Actinomycetia bacterium]|nr:hypothetical protein [Actinomycetes bacterium]
MTFLRRTVLIRIAATIVAAIGLGACSEPTHPATAPSVETPPASAGVPIPFTPAPGGAPLPPDSALIDVMSRLSDPAVPGDQKVALIEGGTPDEAPSLDNFGVALRDNGSLPLAFEARDLAWSQSHPGNVVATVLVRTANPVDGEFIYPMEFARADGSWQLTRKTAEQLLQLGNEESTEPPAPPAIEPPPPPPAIEQPPPPPAIEPPPPPPAPTPTP